MRSWGYALPGGLLKGGSFLRPERRDSLPLPETYGALAGSHCTASTIT